MLVSEFNALGVIGSCHFGQMTYVPLAEVPSEVGSGVEIAEASYAFNPGADFNFDAYLDYLVNIGCTAVFLTTKHVDGLRNWPFAQFGPARLRSDGASLLRPVLGPVVPDISGTAWYATYSIDVVKSFVDAARLRGLRVGFYYAVGDTFLHNTAGYAFNSSQYLEWIDWDLYDLLTRYGVIDFIVLDAWGSDVAWAGGGYPTFVDIPLATIYNKIKGYQSGTLVIVNNHDDTSGDIRLDEFGSGPEGERQSGYTTMPGVLQWRPVQIASVVSPQTDATVKWFIHTDSPTEPLQPAVRRALAAQSRMLNRGYVIAHNISIGTNGRLRDCDRDILIAMAQHRVRPLEVALESHWKFEELTTGSNAIDEVGAAFTLTGGAVYGNTLTQHETPGLGSGAKGGTRLLNSAPWFGRASDKYMQTGNISFSFAGYFRLTTITTFPMIFAKDNGASACEYCLFVDSGNGNRLTWRCSEDGTILTDCVGPVISAGTTYFFTAVHNAATNPNALWLFWNGSNTASIQDFSNNGVLVGTAPFNVGCRANGDLLVNGWVDELRFWKDRAITLPEHIQLYNGGLGLDDNLHPLSAPNTVTDLVLYYPMDAKVGSTVLDYSGHNRTGVVTATTAIVAGKVRGALDFQSQPSKVATTHHPELNGTPISAFAWVKPDTLQSLATIFHKALGAATFLGWYLRKASGTDALNAVISVAGGFHTAAAGDLVVDVWQHVGFTFDGETLIAYKDGVAGTPVTAPSGPIDLVSANLTIGNDPDDTGRHFDGKIDEVRIYNRALTAAEVKRLKNRRPIQQNGRLLHFNP